MRRKFILYTLGLVLMFFSLAMSVPAVLDFLYNKHGQSNAFLIIGSIGFGVGFLLSRNTKVSFDSLSPADMFVTTSVIWFLMAVFSALPFTISPFFPTFADALFESMSGLTTTGASVLEFPEKLTPGLLWWRFLLQWIGGIGIIVLAVFIIPNLKTKGLVLFSTESSEISDKTLPLFSQNVKAIVETYLFLSAACCLSLWAAGMPFNEAAMHMMATVSTGGFSVYGDSVLHYPDLPLVPWILSFFMVVSALPLLSVVLLLTKQSYRLKQDSQIKTFLSLWITFNLIMIFYRLWNNTAGDNLLSTTVLNVTSAMTTTGFAMGDFESWGPMSSVFFFIFMSLGGCAGSTAGGLKMFRTNILFKTFFKHLKNMITPHAVFIPRFNGEPIDDESIINAAGFLTVYIGCFFIIAILAGLSGLDFTSAFGGTITTLSNSGPGLGKLIGPVSNFSGVSSFGKYVFVLSMMLGRLEFLTIITLFLPSTWKRN